MLELRLLDPATDLDLYREAYNWREPKKHLQPDRMPFEVFASDDPLHISIGLFNGSFLAVYFLHESEPGVFGVHFTSKRHADREALIQGAKSVIEQFFKNGAKELVAWIKPRNKALRRFVEDLGFVTEREKTFRGKEYIEYSVQNYK